VSGRLSRRSRFQLEDLWVASAEEALDNNSSSFAVLPLTTLLKEGGAIDRLKKQGYEVQQPQ
jgi:hypothetical protein